MVLIIIIWSLASQCGGPSEPVATKTGGTKTSTTLKSTTTTAPPITVSAKVLPRGLPAPRYDGAAVTAGGKVMVLGGLTSVKASTNVVWAFDPATGSTTATGTLAVPLHDQAAGVLGDNAYVFGGAGPTAPGTYDTVQSIGPADKKAAVVGKLPKARTSATGYTDAGGPTMYVVGGLDGANPANPTNDVLATIDGVTFTTVATLTQPVRYPAVAVSGNYLWVFGGEWNNAQTAAIQRVDLTKHQSTVVAQLPQAMSHAMAFVASGTVFLAGGRTGTSRSNQILRFDPKTFTFTAAGTLVTHLSDASVAVVGTSVFLLGGQAPVATAQIEQLTPSR